MNPDPEYKNPDNREQLNRKALLPPADKKDTEIFFADKGKIKKEWKSLQQFSTLYLYSEYDPNH